VELADLTQAGDLLVYCELKGLDVPIDQMTLAVANELKALHATVGRLPGRHAADYRPAYPMTAELTGGSHFWSFFLPPQAGINEGNLAPFIHDLAIRHGACANTFAALTFAIGPTLSGVSPFFGLSRIRATARPQLAARQLAAIALVQAALRTDIDRHLALDVAAGTQRHPELVREIYTESSPLACAMLMEMLKSTQKNDRTDRTGFRNKQTLDFEEVPHKEMRAAGAALEAAGWLEGFRFNDPYQKKLFSAVRGAKLRKLLPKDLLNLW